MNKEQFVEKLGKLFSELEDEEVASALKVNLYDDLGCGLEISNQELGIVIQTSYNGVLEDGNSIQIPSSLLTQLCKVLPIICSQQLLCDKSW